MYKEPVLRVRIHQDTSGKEPVEILRSIELSFSDAILKRDLEKVKRTTLDHTDRFIESKRKRDEGNATEKWRLSQRRNLIKVLRAGTKIEQTRSSRFRLSIGNFSFLDKHAPYWYKVNYGGKIEMNTPGGGVYGYFGRGESPMKGGMGQVFHAVKRVKGTNPYTRSSGSFSMVPIKPIPPMYYLNEMAKVFEIEMRLLKEQYKQKIKDATNKVVSKKDESELSESEIDLLISKGYDVNKLSLANLNVILKNIKK